MHSVHTPGERWDTRRPEGLRNINGQITFTVTSSTAETVTYTATDSTDSLTLSDTVEVTFVAAAIPTLQQNRGVPGKGGRR
jgi:hypothetical protein